MSSGFRPYFLPPNALFEPVIGWLVYTPNCLNRLVTVALPNFRSRAARSFATTGVGKSCAAKTSNCLKTGASGTLARR
ncbi:MAG: hypothetical protein IJB97_08265 [Clostridia bacterium]|nr:hypothetical protein [Clostridia bacterium]